MSIDAQVTLQSQNILPSGKTAGDFQYKLFQNGSLSATVTSPGATMSFGATAAGTYTVSAVRLATDGTVIGTAVTSNAVTIAPAPAPAPSSAVDVPVSITVSLG